MIRAGIVGISGYAGEELLKILSKHPQVKITYLSGRVNESKKKIKDIYPKLDISENLDFDNLDYLKVKELTDVVFLALPHKISMGIVPELLKLNKKVVDLSADFRIKDAKVYEQWYGEKHQVPELLSKAVYGLPEIYRDEIKKSVIVANPGCYPTTVVLGCAPLLKSGLIDMNSIIIDAKSGVSGGGRKFVADYYANSHPTHRAYNIAGTHRHIPEIEQELSQIAGSEIKITFTPHIIPVERGMLSTIYMNLIKKVATTELLEMYNNFYKGKQFVKILANDMLPETRNVVNTNICEIGLKVDERTNRVVILSAIDNLVKGAAGQAVQNMNLMFGFNEIDGFNEL